MRWRRATVLTSAAIFFAAGCASPTAPTSPVEILPTKYTLACDGWSPRVPPVVRTLVDLHFRNGDDNLETALGIVRSNGGHVTHVFSVGGRIRAEMDVARLSALFWPTPLSPKPALDLYWAYTVTDPTAFKVILIVRLSHPVSDADLAAAVNLGGTIRNVYTSVFSGYSVEIEEATLPLLKALPGVTSANFSGIGCLVAS